MPLHRSSYIPWQPVKVAFLAITLVAALVTSPISPASAATTVSGRAYVDGDLNGEFDGIDFGYQGLTVRAYDGSGALVGSDTTSNEGEYSISIDSSEGALLRIEFDTPSGYEPSFAGASSTSIQFVQAGDTNVNYGVQVPADYCGNNGKIASVCLYQGPAGIAASSSGTDRVLGLSAFSPSTKMQYNVPVASDETVTTLTTKDKVGATWGLGYQRDKQLLWNSAMVRRHAGLGPKGLGGLYVTNTSGQMVASFDLAADKGLTFAATPSDFTDANRDIVTSTATSPTRSFVTQSRDVPGFGGVGKAGIGDIDVSTDSAYLWLVNLYERKIHRFPIGGTASAPTLGTVQSWPIDNGHTCTKPVLRAWGIDPNSDGTLNVAAVCTDEGLAAPTSFPGEGIILRLDPTKTGTSAWSTVTTVDFSYKHKYDYCDIAPRTCHWHRWSDDIASISAAGSVSGGEQHWYTQPMILDLETLGDGSIVLGVSDRMSYQSGYQNYKPAATTNSNPGYMTGWTAGDSILICKTDSGYLQESSGSCAGTNKYFSSRTDEFFYDTFGHPETVIGGMALARGSLAIASMDPAAYYTSGIRWVNTVNGDQTNALNLNNTMGKVSSIGDLEALCDQAPIQIGNRLWYDSDKDGIQDANEKPIVGVTVHLYAADETTLLGTAITNAKGEYYFNSNLTEVAAGDGDNVGGGLTVDQIFVIKLDLASDFAAGGGLHECSLTTTDATDDVSALDDSIDNDATAQGSAWVITTRTTKPGVNDHTYDFGCHNPAILAEVSQTPTTTTTTTTSPQPTTPATLAPISASSGTKPVASTGSVSVGDFVWLDRNGDGIQGTTDKGVRGAILRLTTTSGQSVIDIFGNKVKPITTKNDGKYLFTNLPPGQYIVKITYPTGFRPTVAKKPNRVRNSSSYREKSLVLRAGQSDRTLDFGVVGSQAGVLPATR